MNSMGDTASGANQASQQLRLIGATAHDLKTPLALISGLSSLLESEELTPAQQQEYIRKIYLSSERTLNLVEGLISATRVSRGQISLPLEPIDIGWVMHKITSELSAYAKLYGCRLEVKRSRNLPTVLTNRDAMQRVLYNLTDNAIRHSHQGKKVLISARADDGMVRVSVRDYGVGVRKSDLKRVLDGMGRVVEPNPAHAGSSGLGLYIADSLSLATGAKLMVKALSKGSVFYVRMPIASQLAMF